MSETTMKIKLLAHTQLSGDFVKELVNELDFGMPFTNGQAIALSAIRTCYSANKPSEIVKKEGAKYFGSKATDGGAGSEADRLFRHIMSSKHTSTMEHLSFTFAIEGVSRSLLAQLTRHRAGFSFSVQSQRYVRFGSDDKSGGFDFEVPETVLADEETNAFFVDTMFALQDAYDKLRELGIPAEDARSVLPNAAATNLVMTVNLTALLSFYSKRKPGNGAQKEITDLAVALKDAVISVEPWTKAYFDKV